MSQSDSPQHSPQHSPEPSGALLLAEEEDALAARLALTATATETIDVQYYIWAGDAVGIIVIRELLRAALRGVRIRLLVDDIHFISYDRRVLALDTYDNVEIRSFNPFRYRFKDAPLHSIAEILSGASRLNHRMHNKVFAVDGSAAIIGGRNLSNEYFGAHAHFNFRDIDVLTTGPAVDAIVNSFDEYWHSQWAVPLKELHKRRIKPLVMGQLQEGFSAADRRLIERIDALPVRDFLASKEDEVAWGEIEVLADPPQKTAGREGFDSPVRRRLFELSAAAREEILIENGYFIPRDEGLARLREQVERGVRIKVLTNSLASNDTGLSHAGYQRYRTRLLEARVELFELRADAALAAGFELSERGDGEVGLHSKAATLDRELAFVGSYNLDPRSAFINTEIGVIVHHAGFARRLAEVIEAAMARSNSWRLSLLDDGSIEWRHDGTRGGEPPAKWRKRLLAWILSMLPVERQL